MSKRTPPTQGDRQHPQGKTRIYGFIELSRKGQSGVLFPIDPFFPSFPRDTKTVVVGRSPSRRIAMRKNRPFGCSGHKRNTKTAQHLGVVPFWKRTFYELVKQGNLGDRLFRWHVALTQPTREPRQEPPPVRDKETSPLAACRRRVIAGERGGPVPGYHRHICPRSRSMASLLSSSPARSS